MLLLLASRLPHVPHLIASSRLRARLLATPRNAAATRDRPRQSTHPPTEAPVNLPATRSSAGREAKGAPKKLVLAYMLDSSAVAFAPPHRTSTVLPMPYRILLTTHHITSQAKLSALRSAAREHNVSCLLKTGAHPPGVMLCEGNTAEDVRAWHAVVKRLRYKGYSFVGGCEVPARLLNGGKAGFTEVGSKKEMGEHLGEEGKAWWRAMMGWK